MPKKKKIRLIIFILMLGTICDAQVQIGNDIEGEFEGDEFGTTVSMSDDGKIVAIGAPRNSDTVYHVGHARVYKLINNNWEQLGNDINGAEKYDWFGYSVAVSGNGLRVAIGAYKNEAVKVYEIQFGNWTQVGQDIIPEIPMTGVHEVSISYDGNIVAIEPHSFSAQTIFGNTRVFKLTNNEWSRFGNDDILTQQNGWSISLSSDGLTMAIGSIGNDDNGDDSGQVRIFRFIDEKWTQIGHDINGKGEGYSFGWSVSLSSDGNRIAIGGPGSLYFAERPCYVGIFEFISEEWIIMGQGIDGYVNEGFGWDVVLSGDGNRIAVASPNNRNCPVRIFDFIGGKWKQVGKSIKNKREIDLTGYSIGMSKDGDMVTAASIRSVAGYAHIYDISGITVEENLTDGCIEKKEEGEILAYKLFPNPTSGNLTVQGVDLEDLRANKKLNLFDVLGRRIEGYEVQEDLIDLNYIPAGTYFLMIDDRWEKIIKVRF